MKIITVTGSVGAGKTTLAKKLCNRLNFKYIDVNKIISKHDIAEGYDEERKAKIVDTKKLNKALIKEIMDTEKTLSNPDKKPEKRKNKQNGLIIDSHMSHFLPKTYANLCIVAKCDLKTLYKRLKQRKYSKEKIRENLDAEIFDVCLNEARENKHNILVIDTTKGININYVSRKVGGLIARKQD